MPWRWVSSVCSDCVSGHPRDVAGSSKGSVHEQRAGGRGRGGLEMGVGGDEVVVAVALRCDRRSTKEQCGLGASVEGQTSPANQGRHRTSHTLESPSLLLVLTRRHGRVSAGTGT